MSDTYPTIQNWCPIWKTHDYNGDHYDQDCWDSHFDAAMVPLLDGEVLQDHGGHPVKWRPCDNCYGTGEVDTPHGPNETDLCGNSQCVGGMIPAGTIVTPCSDTFWETEEGALGFLPGQQVLVIQIGTPKETDDSEGSDETP